VKILDRQAPLQRAASRLAHALSLLWITSSAPAAFTATGGAAAALPDGGQPAVERGDSTAETHDAADP
jgi:hypothetical protein